jgi:hypothetical protein
LPKLPELLVCTSSAAASTWMVSVTAPTSSFTSTVVGWLKLTGLLDETNFLNPSFCTVMVYSPTCTESKT